MDTLLIERHGRLFLAHNARVVRPGVEVSTDLAAATADWDVEKSSPHVKWIVGDFVESDQANSNGQYWTREDLLLGEYSIKYAPLNMLHKQRQPVGFFAGTRTVDLTERASENASAPVKIEALSGLWSHLFPFESALVDQADEAGSLFYSMECRGTHVHCTGPAGCDQSYDYMAVETHCAHLRERSSVRHIVNPTFRGGAIIIPPTRPGWKEANASVLQEAAIREEASRYAEMTESAYNQVNADGADLSPGAWESLMATILSFADQPESGFGNLPNV